jgi:lactoylglutathione lyase
MVSHEAKDFSMIKLVTLSFNTSHLQEMVSFYRAVGAVLDFKTVSKGGSSYQGQLGQLNLVFYEIPKSLEKVSPNFSMKVEVENLQQVMANLQEAADFSSHIIMDQEVLPQGKTSILLDPEGHSLELIELWPGEEEFS